MGHIQNIYRYHCPGPVPPVVEGGGVYLQNSGYSALSTNQSLCIKFTCDEAFDEYLLRHMMPLSLATQGTFTSVKSCDGPDVTLFS